MKPKHDQAPQQKNYETLGHELARAAEERPDTCVRKLNAGANKPPFTDILAREPLVAKERYAGKQQEGLTHLVVVGGSVLGISRVFNHPKEPGHFGTVDSVRVSVLPFGPAAERIQSSRTLLEVRPARLLHPRADGAVQAWESIAIGRREIAAATGVTDPATGMIDPESGVEDPTVSGQHVGIEVTADGNVRITDLQSTNGTEVLSMDDFGYNGLTDQGQQLLADTRRELDQKPWMWDNQYADTTARIIDPQ